MAYDFDKIARTYDRLNRVMTLGLDRRWRKRAAREVESGKWKEEKVKNLRFFIKKCLKILSVPKKALPLHPLNGTRVF